MAHSKYNLQIGTFWGQLTAERRKAPRPPAPPNRPGGREVGRSEGRTVGRSAGGRMVGRSGGRAVDLSIAQPPDRPTARLSNRPTFRPSDCPTVRTSGRFVFSKTLLDSSYMIQTDSVYVGRINNLREFVENYRHRDLGRECSGGWIRGIRRIRWIRWIHRLAGRAQKLYVGGPYIAVVCSGDLKT